MMSVSTWPETFTLPIPPTTRRKHPSAPSIESMRAKKVTRLATGLKYPNGLAVTPDQKQAHRCGNDDQPDSELSTSNPTGSLGPPKTVYQFPNSSVDGIMFDEYDRLWVARWLNATVDVITLDGKLVAEIPAGGSKVTNLCFWGQERIRHGR